jgi:hypothetical protein
MAQPVINYNKIKEEVFRLPLSQRIRLFNELKEADIKKAAFEAYKSLSKKISKKKITENDIDKLIHTSRKSKNNL